jgi:hypothetical protein
MTIKQPLESTLIGVGDNYIVLDGVQSYVDIVYTVKGVQNETFNFTYVANNGIVNLNIREITRLVYDNVEFYQDPFDYSGDKLYTETDGYHFIKIDIDITDGNDDNLQINDIRVINAALDVGECLILASLEDEVLDETAGKSVETLIGLNFDLNYSIH